MLFLGLFVGSLEIRRSGGHRCNAHWGWRPFEAKGVCGWACVSGYLVRGCRRFQLVVGGHGAFQYRLD
nr:MAG TPA: hypothetical protein [Caudoviricetes sp.]